jgi:hypothetical protein
MRTWIVIVLCLLLAGCASSRVTLCAKTVIDDVDVEARWELK